MLRQVSTPDMPRRSDAARPPNAPEARQRPMVARTERACSIAKMVVAVAIGEPAARPDGTCPPARAAAFARQIAMYLAHVGFGLPMGEVGRAFGRDRTTVVHACHLIEDRRDEARFDTMLDHLEQAAGELEAASRLKGQD